MQKILNKFLKRKVSTKLIDDMPCRQASTALDRRVNSMLLMHAFQPVSAPEPFEALSNPLQTSAI